MGLPKFVQCLLDAVLESARASSEADLQPVSQGPAVNLGQEMLLKSKLNCLCFCIWFAFNRGIQIVFGRIQSERLCQLSYQLPPFVTHCTAAC